jgi:hypothetical protein
MDEYPVSLASAFMLGRRIVTPMPTPLEFKLTDPEEDAEDECVAMPALFNRGILLLRDDLLAAMAAAGVDNLDAYEAVVREPDGSRSYTNYKAVNIVGLVAAADMSRSKATVHPGGPVIDVEFDDLVLDPSRARGALMFRLAEATGSIFIHDRLRRHLLASGFDELTFLPPGEAFV